jgi:segregation and condensation protein B
MTEQGSPPNEPLADEPRDEKPRADETATEEFFSLEELGSIYAKALQGTSDSEQIPVPRLPQPDRAADELTATILVQGETDGTPVTLSSILEALLFVGHQDGRSLNNEELQRILKEFSESEIEAALGRLQSQFVEQNACIHVVQDKHGYRLELLPEVEESLQNLQAGPVREATLSQPAIDCLAVIAYQPGIERQQLEELLGPSVKSILSQLEKRGLIVENNQAYHTCDRFLEIVGIESLDDLPRDDKP